MYTQEKIEALLRARINEDAFNIERVYFVKTDRRCNPKKANPIKYSSGSIPVLVSAPHSVRHIRHKKIKASDEFTGSLACMLNRLTDCHALAVTKLYGGDPNYDSDCIYKEALKEAARKNRVKLVIDLHGASREHNFDVDIGTMMGASLLGKKQFPVLLKKHLNDYGITSISENRFTVSDQNTVTRYVSGILEIPAIQLEINRKFRVPHQNGLDYCRLAGALTEFIKSVGIGYSGR
ncbi:MAG: hypothetical protein CVU89_14600 [Firmicutes bacterium HGW-Firmicutes-14]|nr:MAG: hypothetical protein CVU89_14600 [Firmicutes bacterium HGW-Firmicutes-14]